jgi:hypothetical protein
MNFAWERQEMFNRIVFAVTAIAVAGVLVTASAPALARSHTKSSAAATENGAPDDNSACRRDVRRFCRHVKAGEGSGAFLTCLQDHRSRLSKPCDHALKSHGL